MVFVGVKSETGKREPQGSQIVFDGTGALNVVFDGVCAFCNGSIGFLLRHDKRQRYHFAAMQSEPGRRLLLDHRTASVVSRPLKNYLRCPAVVKNSLKMLIYSP